MKHRLSSSKIALGRHCLWWARGDVELPHESCSDDAMAGIVFHDAMRIAINTWPKPLTKETLRTLADDGGVDQDELTSRVEIGRAYFDQCHRDALTAPELAFAINPYTGNSRPLKTSGQRDYSQSTNNEVPGTIDMVSVCRIDSVSKSTAFVDDWKTGHGPHRFIDHIDQMSWQSAAVGLWLGAEATPGVVHVKAGEWCQDFGDPLEGMDLDVFLADLRAMLDEIPIAEPHPGVHCETERCPAMAVCPAVGALLLAAEVPDDSRRRLPILRPVRSQDEALAVLVAVPLLQAWLDRKKAEAQVFADAVGGLESEGKVYRGRETKVEKAMLDVDGAWSALASVLGDSVIKKAIKTTSALTWEGLDKAIREVRKDLLPADVVAMVKDTKDALREIGALKKSTYNKYQWIAKKAPKKDKEE